MNYNEKLGILENSDRFPNSRLDGRDTEAVMKVFKFVHHTTRTLKVGDTIEIGRLPASMSVVGIIFRNDFSGVKYSIGVSTGNSKCIISNSTKKDVTNWIPPYPASSASVYITIEDGEVEIGTNMNGAIMFC